MNTSERIFGQFQEFREWAKREFKMIHDDHLMIIAKLDKLSHDRDVMFGKLVVLNSVIIVLLEIVGHKALG